MSTDADNGRRRRTDAAAASGLDADPLASGNNSLAIAAATRRRRRRMREQEGDVLTLHVLAATIYSRFASVAGFRMLLKPTTPRRALVPRPPWPPPPLTPVLLLPPQKHVPTVHLGPKLHRAQPRFPEWGTGAAHAPETLGVAFLSLDAAAAAYARMERSVVGHSFGASERFELLEAAANLLPEGLSLIHI